MTLDLLCLRAFVAIVDGGSFAAGAARVHRSLSTVSQQMERLGQAVGHPLFVRQGRRMVPSEAGHRLLPHARRLLAEEERALSALRAPDLAGPVSIGAVQDFAEDVLPETLRRFRASHPGVRLSARVAGSGDLAEAVARGAVDLALREAEAGARPVTPCLTLPMIWIGAGAPAADGAEAPGAPIPLILVEGPCPYRRAALQALDTAGLAWRCAYESPSLAALRAAVIAGLGVTARTPRFLGAGLRARADLPPLPAVSYGIDRASRHPAPAVAALSAALEAAVTGLSPSAGGW